VCLQGKLQNRQAIQLHANDPLPHAHGSHIFQTTSLSLPLTHKWRCVWHQHPHQPPKQGKNMYNTCRGPRWVAGGTFLLKCMSSSKVSTWLFTQATIHVTCKGEATLVSTSDGCTVWSCNRPHSSWYSSHHVPASWSNDKQPGPQPARQEYYRTICSTTCDLEPHVGHIKPAQSNHTRSPHDVRKVKQQATGFTCCLPAA